MAKKKQKKKDNEKLIPIILSGVGVLVVLVIAIVLLSIFTGPRSKVISYWKASTNYDAKKLCGSMHPELFKAFDLDNEDCVDLAEQMFKFAKDNKYNIEDMDYKITDKKVLSKDEVEEIQETLEEMDSPNEFPKISKVIRYRVKIKVELNDGTINRTTQYYFVAKIKGKWGVLGWNTDKSFRLDGLGM